MLYVASDGTANKPYFSIEKFKRNLTGFFPSPTYNLTLDKTYFIVNQSGRVGIGTASPSHKLHVVGTGFFSGKLIAGDLDVNGNTFISGNLGLGTATPQEKLDVRGNIYVKGDVIIRGQNNNVSPNERTQIKLSSNGDISARNVKVDFNTIPDYVFKEDYELMPLNELEVFIKENKHLPNIKSEKEYNEAGSLDLGELNLKLLEKVEELTLYILQQQEQIDLLSKKIETIK